MINTPTRDEAITIVEKAIKNLRALEPDTPAHIPAHFRQHLYKVAEAAEIIAARTKILDPKIAYIFGLLHDYGKFFGDAFDKKAFHGLTGYCKFMDKNMPELARICLTHTFIDKNFIEDEYASYPLAEIAKVKLIFNDIQFSDYDKLIQLADLLADGPNDAFNNISYRLNSIKIRYNVPQKVADKRLQEALNLKKEVERLTNCDIYKLLETEDDVIMPTRAKAEEIWQEGIDYRQAHPHPFKHKDEYIFHTKGVAITAETIAKHIEGMDDNKAYILGLLHDYGKRVNQSKENKFHGQEGYEQMKAMGYDEIAQICLTHTFPCKNFDYKQFAFPKEWMDWSYNELQKLEYNDYDLLISLCDKFVEGYELVSIEKRVEAIAVRYGLDDYQKEVLYNQSIKLKHYFDDKTGKDIYEILQIKD